MTYRYYFSQDGVNVHKVVVNKKSATIYELKEWCRQNIGSGASRDNGVISGFNWFSRDTGIMTREISNSGHPYFRWESKIIFYFQESKDATLFALHWA